MADSVETSESPPCVMTPTATADVLAPLLAALAGNTPALEPRRFPRGTLLPDGRLDLSKQALGPHGFARVAATLKTHVSVRHLLLGGNSLGNRGAGEVGALLAANRHIQTVFLSNNEISPAGVEWLVAGARAGGGVRALWLESNPLGAAGVTKLCPLLRGPDGIHTLALGNADLGAEGIAALTEALAHPDASVRGLYLGRAGLAAAETSLLRDLLTQAHSLRHLCLGLNLLGDDGVAILAEALGGVPHLEALGLASVGVGDAGVAALAEALRAGASLVTLDLGHRPSAGPLGSRRNALGNPGTIALAAALAAGAKLQHLSLAGNPIGLTGARSLAEALEAGTALQTLRLSRGVPRDVRQRIRRCVPDDMVRADAAERAAIASVYRSARRRSQAPLPRPEGAGAAPSSSATPVPPLPSQEELEAAARTLEALAQRPGDFAAKDPALRAVRAGANRLIASLQQRSKALRSERVQGARSRGKRGRGRDREALDATGIRAARGQREASAARRALGAPPGEALGTSPGEPQELSSRPAPRRLDRPRRCYLCGEPFRALDAFYDAHCPPCAVASMRRRNDSVEMTGRHILVTGGRVKIGREVALRLLRAGAWVTVTTRFPTDAAQRFAAEPDCEVWATRLSILGLDLLDLPGTVSLGGRLAADLPHLDGLVHNAAMTIRRPAEFYAHLLAAEPEASLGLPEVCGSWLPEPRSTPRPSLGLPPRGLPATTTAEVDLASAFPPGVFEDDGQQADHRAHNSWRLPLGEVDPRELVEVHAVSCLAPFLLTQALLPALRRSPKKPAVVVHVTAMEGNFSRPFKSGRHPHTNMAKAAMNMLTRTSGEHLAAQGVHLVSVDTGWVTDENPHPVRVALRQERGFQPPLDEIEGAARVTDPLFRAARGEDVPTGVFLKDYRPHPW